MRRPDVITKNHPRIPSVPPWRSKKLYWNTSSDDRPSQFRIIVVAERHPPPPIIIIPPHCVVLPRGGVGIGRRRSFQFREIVMRRGIRGDAYGPQWHHCPPRRSNPFPPPPVGFGSSGAPRIRGHSDERRGYINREFSTSFVQRWRKKSPHPLSSSTPSIMVKYYITSGAAGGGTEFLDENERILTRLDRSHRGAAGLGRMLLGEWFGPE